ncbi:unnamed protein product, partial [Discosporangium mesarthrocarpum]
TSGFLHTATLRGLAPSTRYYYACGSKGTGLSTTRSFKTPPEVGPNHPLTLSILGDLGQTEDSQ